MLEIVPEKESVEKQPVVYLYVKDMGEVKIEKCQKYLSRKQE